MSKELNDVEIPESPININSADIDKIFTSDKFRCGKKDCKRFTDYKNSENNENNFFLCIKIPKKNGYVRMGPEHAKL